jgi:hypothetical protein
MWNFNGEVVDVYTIEEFETNGFKCFWSSKVR